jgi:hypothetical protein
MGQSDAAPDAFLTGTPGAALTEAERTRLARIADTLIAGGAGLSPASHAEVPTEWIDRVFAIHPERHTAVLAVPDRHGDPDTLLTALRENDPDTLSAFAIAGAHLINPRIHRELGYPGPPLVKYPALPDEADAYLEDGILNVVINRGPIYRPTPQAI